ncbi:TIGR02646 family protein [Saccharospirillum sp. MSK14-1]|uniref:retron system putative HNH endonuclease n=1 Tax=Saccharospirillum sp. MSK14-1 TaxID=1897632 RepID=UPI000D3AADE3|nr:retron system putative HNH endonuclease [Saccharospirillum sp. MSK14-1]PTY37597.1 TIGR02646 family protein [Saccharospirillum sp. MSK14-1]
MRRITKTHPPRRLTEWRDENSKVNHAYGDLQGTEAFHDLKSKLLQEQGWLCAYTGRLIDAGSSHVEHIKPQCKCAEWEDVEYRNVVACFPADGGDLSHGYGAPVKANWWDRQRFVSPLSVDCERRFRFVWSGHIRPNPDGQEDATETIKVLGLDEKTLRQLRKSRIDGFFGFGSRTQNRPLSINEARVALANIESHDSNGRLQEFCFVLKQLLPKYIAQTEG